MAKKSMILKQQAPAKFSTRKYNRCKICGRPHAYLRNWRHLPYLLPRVWFIRARSPVCARLPSDFASCVVGFGSLF